MRASIQVSRICLFCLNFEIQESLKFVFSLIWVIRIVLIFPLFVTWRTAGF